MMSLHSNEKLYKSIFIHTCYQHYIVNTVFHKGARSHEGILHIKAPGQNLCHYEAIPDEKPGLAKGQPDFHVDDSLISLIRFFIDENLLPINVWNKLKLDSDGTLILS